MIRFATDENFDNHILHALSRRYPELDVIRIQDTHLYGANDEESCSGAPTNYGSC